MGASDLLIVVGLPAAVLAAAVTFGLVLPRFRRARLRRQGITLAAFADPSIVAPPRPSRPPTPESAPLISHESVTPTHAAPAPSPYAPPLAATGTSGAAWAEPVTPLDPPKLRLSTAADRFTVPPAEPKPNLRVHRPVDGTLQFLPGRLEVIEGRDIGEEFRFVRQPGAAETEITIGRQDGVLYRHIQLHEPTVSRLHAKLTLEGKDWRLTNLSETNPASVNGAPLGAQNGSAILKDGDRLEMGEVAFRFRAK